MSQDYHASRSLDDWYRTVNRIYLDRNYYRTTESILAHLVEVIGGLSLLASGKQKPGVEPQRHLPKALAWWMALCAKVGVPSLEDMVWSKFPLVCPYCRLDEHEDAVCGEMKRESAGFPDWNELRKKAELNAAKRPSRLTEWQQMFNRIYKVQQVESYNIVFARLAEELGELAEAVRLVPIAPGYFLSEAADLFAWLMHLQTLYVLNLAKSGGIGSSQLFEHLSMAFFREYPDRCPDCGNQVCTCPPILSRTVGRIAHEMPVQNGTGPLRTPLLTFDEARKVFELSSSRLVLAEREIEIDGAVIAEIHRAVTELQDKVLEHVGLTEANTVTLLKTLSRVEELTESERVTQETMEELASAISCLPKSTRSVVLQFLTGLASSAWAGALLELVKTLPDGLV